MGPARPPVDQSKTVPRPCPAGLPNAAQTGLADTQSVNSHDVNKQNIAAQDTPEGPPPSTEKQQKIPKPQVPPPPPRSESDRDRFELILSPKSKVKIEAAIQKWYKKYPCLSDTLSPKPMIGPAMKINLKKELAGQKYPKKAMTAVLIPRHYKQASNELIEELLNSKVIRRVKKSAVPKFQSRSFVVEKQGTPELAVRLVIDFSEANKWIERLTHPFTAENDLLNLIPETAQFFCKMDALWGYFQIELDEDSREITTFIHELGIFEYLRAPMGLNASGDEFCRRSDEATAGLPNVIKLIDDILVWGETLEELFECTENVLKACNERNITLSRKKLHIGKCTTFAGFQVSCRGKTPTEDRLQAIKAFPTPTTLTVLRGFLGLANQLFHFIPDGA